MGMFLESYLSNSYKIHNLSTTQPSLVSYIFTVNSGGGAGGTYCTGGKGAVVTTRHAVAPSAWGSIVAVVVGGVGGASTSSANKAGGYGSGNGGYGEYVNANDYATGGGGGSSVSLGVTTLLQS